MTNIFQQIKTFIDPVRQYVSTPDDVKNIADVKVGDVLLGMGGAHNTVTGIEIIRKGASHIEINDGKYHFASEQTVFANGNFTHAKTLKEGDVLQDIDGYVIVVENVKRTKDDFAFYRFEVDGDHTYFINKILVHNASRYWVGGTGDWNTSTTHWSASSGGAGGASTPGSGDAVYFDLHSNESGDGDYSVSVTSQRNCSDFSAENPPSGTLTFDFGTQGAGGVVFYGNVLFGAGMVVNGDAQVLLAASATGKTITTNGVALGHIDLATFSANGGWTLQDALTCGGLNLIGGNFNTGNFDITLDTWGFSVSASFGAPTITLGTSTITTPAVAINNGTYTSLSVSSATFIVDILDKGSPGFQCLKTGVTFASVTMNNGGRLQANGCTITTFECSLGATSVCSDLYLITAPSITITNLTLSGYSQTTNRLQILGGGTITSDSPTLSYIDFLGLTAVSASAWTGTSLGDGGDNTNITFTTPVTRYWVGNGGAWNDTAHWSASTGGSTGATMPLGQDDVIFDSNSFSSGSQTVTMPPIGIYLLCTNITWAGVTNSPTWELSGFPGTVSYVSGQFQVMGDFILDAGMTFDNTTYAVANSTSPVTIVMYSASDVDFKSAGQDICALTCYGAGKVTLLDDLIVEDLEGDAGIFDANDFDISSNMSNPCITAGNLYVEMYFSSEVYMGSGTWQSGGNYFDFGDATLHCETSTFKVTGDGTGGGYAEIYAGTQTFYNIWIDMDTPVSDAMYFYGSGWTANDLKLEPAQVVKFESGATITLTTFTAIGTVGNLIVITDTDSAGFTMTAASGIISCDYLDLSYSTVDGGAGWYAGHNSNNTIGNSGWNWGDWKDKTLTETVRGIPVYDRTGTWGRQFSEVLVMAGAVTNARIYFRELVESLAIAVTNTVKQTAKLLLETVKVAVSFVSVATLFKVLQETLTATGSYLRTLTAYKILTETIKVTGSILKDIGRTLVESLALDELTVAITSVFTKTLTEAITIASAMGNFVIGKLIVQPIRVVASLVNAATLYKVFTEALTVAGTAFNKGAKTFTEAITATTAIAFSISRTFVEVVKMVSNKIYNLSHTFLEIIRVAPVYAKILTAYKVLTESVAVNWGKTVMFARTLKSSLGVHHISVELNRMKVLVQSIRIVDDTLTSFSKMFYETVVVDWKKGTLRAFSYLEHLAVHATKMPFTIGKLLIETILGSTVWEFTKTQFVELTDTIRATALATKRAGKIFTGSITVASKKLYSIARTFVQVIKVAMWQQEARAFIFNEAIGVAEAFGNFVIGKVLAEVVKIKLVFTEGRDFVFSEVIAVSSVITNQTTKIFTEVVQIGLSLTRSIGRTLTQVVKMASTTRFRKTQYKVLSDAISATGQAFNRAGKTFVEVVAITSLLGSWVIGKLIVQPVRVVATYIKAWTLSRVFSETITATSEALNQAGKIFEEAITVSSEWIRGALGKGLYETIKIYEIISKTLPARVFSETVNVAVNLGNQTAKIFIETVNVVGQFVLGTISKLLIEILRVDVVFEKAGVFYKVLSETITATGNALNQTARVFVEAINVVGELGSFAIGKLLTQTITVGTAFTRSMSRIFTQTIKVSANAVKYIFGRIFSAGVGVSGALQSFTIGKLLKETVVIGWSKIKLVLNGIQVGLWKKVARVTNGVWRKISRNDN